jgi:hypothetical protein
LGHDLFGSGLRFFITTHAFGDKLIDFLLRHHPFSDEASGIYSPYARMRLDALVH